MSAEAEIRATLQSAKGLMVHRIECRDYALARKLSRGVIMNPPDSDRVFAGSIPQIYEQYLVPLGGQFLFNVWDQIEQNEFADVVTQALEI